MLADQTLVEKFLEILDERSQPGNSRLGFHLTLNCSSSKPKVLVLVSARAHVRFAFSSERVTIFLMLIRCYLFHDSSGAPDEIRWYEEREDGKVRIGRELGMWHNSRIISPVVDVFGSPSYLNNLEKADRVVRLD